MKEKFYNKKIKLLLAVSLFVGIFTVNTANADEVVSHNLPAEYIELEYVISQDESFLRLGETLGAAGTTPFTVTYMSDTNSGAIAGSGTQGTYTNMAYEFYVGGRSGTFYMRNDDYSNSHSGMFKAGVKQKFEFSPTKPVTDSYYKIDDSKYAISDCGYWGSFYILYAKYFNCNSSKQYFNGKVYEVTVGENLFTPAKRRSDDTAGFYCSNGTFYASGGDNPFIAGPELVLDPECNDTDEEASFAYNDCYTLYNEEQTNVPYEVSATLYRYANPRAYTNGEVSQWTNYSSWFAEPIEETPTKKVETKTFYSHPILYNITYNLDGGVNNVENPSTYSCAEPTIVLKNPIKANHSFDNWTPEGVIESGSTGNKEFTANYSEVELEFSGTYFEKSEGEAYEAVAPDEYFSKPYNYLFAATKGACSVSNETETPTELKNLGTIVARNKNVYFNGVAQFLDSVFCTTENVTIKYGAVQGIYDKTSIEDEALGLTEIGSKTIYYEVSKEGYKTKTGSYTLTITGAESDLIPPIPKQLTYNKESQELVQPGISNTGEVQYKLGVSGIYSTDVPTATDAGTYTVYYKVIGDEYHQGTEEASIDVTINKASIGDKPATSVSKTYTGLLIDNNYNAPEGMIVTGNVSGTDVGTYTATYTPDANHKWSDETVDEVSVTLTINNAEIVVNAPSQSYEYDGEAHGEAISVTTVGAQTATIKYGTENGVYELNAAPTIASAVDNKTIYYKVTAPNHTDKTGSYTLTITKTDGSVTAPTAKTLVYTGSAQTLINAGSSTTGEIQYRLNSGEYSTELPQATNAGEYTVYYKVIGDSNHKDVAEASITVTIKNNAIAVSTTNGEATYTGLATNGGANVTIISPTSGATIKYGTTNGVYDLDAIPTYTNVGTYTVYYKVTATNYSANTGSLTIEISKADGSVTAPGIKTDLVYSGSAQTLINEGSANGTGTIQYKLDSGSYSTDLPQATDAGEYTVYYKVIGDANHNDVDENSVVVTIEKASGSISAPEAKNNLVYSGVEQNLINAGSSTTGTINYALGDSATNAPTSGWSTSIPVGKDAKEYYVWYYSIGDSNHNDTTKACVTAKIAKASITVTANNKSITYGDAPTNNGYAISGFKNSETASVVSGNVTYTYNYSQYEDVGTYSIIPNVSGLSATNYSFVSANGTLLVEQKEIGLSWGTASWAYDGNAHSVTVDATGLVNSDSVSVTLSNNSITDVGNVTVTASALTGGKAGNYKLPSNNTKVISITEASSNWINEPTAKNDLTYTGSAQTLINAGTANNGTAKYKLGEGSYSASIPTAVNAGTYTIYYKVEGDSNHSDTAEASFNVTIAKAQLTVTAKDKTITYGDVPTNDGYIISGYKEDDGSSVISGSVSYSYNYSQYGNVGSYVITPNVSKLNATNYSFVETNGALLVEQKEVTLTWGTSSWTYDGNGHSTTVTVGNTVNGDSVSATLSNNSITDVGSVTVTATGLTGAKAGNYKLPSANTKTISVTGASITVNAPNQTYTYDGNEHGSAISAIVADSQDVTIKYGTTSGTYNLDSAPKATNVADTKTVYYKVTAPNHTDKTGSYTLTINKAPGDVTAPTAKTLSYTGNAQTLIDAGSSTTGTIQYKLGSDGTYATSLPSATDAGTYTVYYKVVGDSNHEDVVESSINVTIKATYLVTWNNDDGTLLQSDNVIEGETPTYAGATPTKPATAQYTYTFNGWDKAISAVTKDTVYTATYSATLNQYTYAFYDEDGETSLKAQTADYGTAITAPENPSKEATEDYSYSFDGWYTEKTGGSKVTSFGALSSDVNYYARYIAIKLNCDITYVMNGGYYGETDELPSKGDVITLEGAPQGNRYRVLDIQNGVAKLLTLDVIDRLKMYNSKEAKQYVTYNDVEYLKYENNVVDSYLNNDWYNSIEEPLKSAIVRTDVEQYLLGENQAGNDVISVEGATYSDSKGTIKEIGTSYINKEGSVTLKNRKAYLASLYDMVEYFDDSNLNLDHLKTFFDDPYTEIDLHVSSLGISELAADAQTKNTQVFRDTFPASQLEVVAYSNIWISNIGVKMGFASIGTPSSVEASASTMQAFSSMTEAAISSTQPRIIKTIINVDLNQLAFANVTQQEEHYVLADVGTSLIMPKRNDYVFDGWYEDSTFSGEEVTNITEMADKTLYAKWICYKPIVQTTNGTAIYNGQPQNGNAKAVVVNPAENTAIMFGKTEGTYNLETVPTYTDVGTYTVYYKASSPLCEEDTTGAFTITINKAEGSIIAPTTKTLTYTGKAQTLINAGSSTTGTIKYKLNSGSYSTSLPSATAAGTYTVYYKVDGDSSHEDVPETSITVEISKAPLVVRAKDNSIVYGSAPANNGVTYEGLVNSQTFSNATDGSVSYTYTYTRYGDVGEYEIVPDVSKITSANYQVISASGVLTVTQKEATLTWGTASWTYDGNAHSVSVTVGGLVNNDQISAETSGNSITEPGTATATVIGLVASKGNANNYKLPSNVSKTITINKATPTVKAPTAKSLTYNGSPQTLINNGTTNGGTMYYRLGTGGEYSAELPQATDAGTYTVYYKVIGDEHYNDTAEKSISVKIATKEITLSTTNGSAIYSGSATNGEASVTVSDPTTGATIKYGTKSGTYNLDAIPTYTKVDTYTVYYKVTATNYTTKTGKFTITINAKPITDDDVTFANISDQTYTGSAIKPAPSISYNGTSLVSGTDYSATYVYNTKPGVASITVTGKGNYSGSKVITFNIIATEYTVDLVSNGGTVESGAKKGDIITIEGASQGSRYRVLDVQDGIAKLLTMDVVNQMKEYSSENDLSYTTIGTEKYLKYEGSDIDNYLENTWYNNMYEPLKSAIVSTDVYQYLLADGEGPNQIDTIAAEYSDKNGTVKTESTYSHHEGESPVYVGKRKAYLPSIYDVAEYYDYSIDLNKEREFFKEDMKPLVYESTLGIGALDTENLSKLTYSLRDTYANSLLDGFYYANMFVSNAFAKSGYVGFVSISNNAALESEQSQLYADLGEGMTKVTSTRNVLAIINVDLSKITYYDSLGNPHHVGTTNEQIVYDVSELPFDLPTPTLNGKSFKGWYDNAEFNGTPIDKITAQANYTLYAKFATPKTMPEIALDSEMAQFTSASSKSVNVVTDSDGAITAESSNTTYFTVKVDGKKVTVTSKSVSTTERTATITVSIAESDTYEPTSITFNVSSKSTSCVTGDTLVTLSDWSTKRIDELTYDDEMIVWNFFDGTYTTTNPFIIFHHENANSYVQLLFSDNNSLNIVDSHKLFDLTTNNWESISEENYNNYIGHEFVEVINGENKAVKLLEGVLHEGETSSWSVETPKHINAVLGNMLTFTPQKFDGLYEYFKIGEDMKYDRISMIKDIDKYGLYTPEEVGLSEEILDYVGGQYFKIFVGKGICTHDDVLQLVQEYLVGEE